MNFFKLYIGDYQRDTAHMSMAEHGAYMLMLQHYYATEKPLPSGKALHRMLRAQDKIEREAIDTVSTQFWKQTDAGLVNERADIEITKASAQAETNARIAREREAKRKAAQKEHEESTNRATKDKPSQTPDTRHQTPKAAVTQSDDSGTSPPPEGISRAGQIATLIREWERKRGKQPKIFSTHPGVIAWAEAGITDKQLAEAYELATDDRDDKRDESPVNVGFMDVFLAKVLKPQGKLERFDPVAYVNSGNQEGGHGRVIDNA